jgi:hypothetical protein
MTVARKLFIFLITHSLVALLPRVSSSQDPRRF